MIELLYIGLAALLVALFMWWPVVIVPARHFAIVEQLGQFQRLLLPGWHVVLRPLQYLKSMAWSYYGQDGKLRQQRFTIGSMEDRQMDVPPVSCLCADKLMVNIDVTIVYTIFDPQRACYEHQDVLNFFYQCAQQSIRSVCAQVEAKEIQYGDHSKMGLLVQEALNEQAQYVGIKCKRVLVQGIQFADDILKKEQAIYASKRQQEMHMAQQQAEHERMMMQLENERAAQASRNRMAQEQLQAQLERERLEHEAERVRKETLQLNTQDVIELKRIEAYRDIFRDAPKKVVFAPADYWSATRYVNTGQNE